MSSEKQKSLTKLPKIKTIRGKHGRFRGYIVPTGTTGNPWKTVYMGISVSSGDSNYGIDGILGPSGNVSLRELKEVIDTLKEDLDAVYVAAEKALKKLRR